MASCSTAFAAVVMYSFVVCGGHTGFTAFRILMDF